MKHLMQIAVFTAAILSAHTAYALFEGSPDDYRVWLKRSMLMLPVIGLALLFYIGFFKELLRRAYRPAKAIKHVRAMTFLGVMVAIAWIYQGIIPRSLFIAIMAGLFAVWFLFFFLFAVISKNEA